jgi:vacuolar-type H+-ATPase subunit E/Vma4
MGGFLMDVKLDSLIEKIRKEGIEEAENRAEQIVKEANQKAAGIIEDAGKEALKVINEGQSKVDQFRATAEADLKQSVRNAELLLKERFNRLFDAVFKREVGEKLTPDLMKEMILKIVETWAKDSEKEVILGDADKKQLEALLFNGIKTDLKKGITLKVGADITSGFRIGLKGTDVYYDFSDGAISDLLKSLVNPNLKSILDK